MSTSERLDVSVALTTGLMHVFGVVVVAVVRLVNDDRVGQEVDVGTVEGRDADEGSDRRGVAGFVFWFRRARRLFGALAAAAAAATATAETSEEALGQVGAVAVCASGFRGSDGSR